ncbi:MAG: NAD(P)-dependent oxidoreductase [Trueperaceae bacterium]|nr:NAD(P)-dependent oxidoreductase [Trueperaceae bacterium]
MSNSSSQPLSRLREAFTETYPAYTPNEAVVEANRCLYCFDAPCIEACPTDIDVPTFIRKIATGNTLGAAVTILESNLMGHTCGRVCPVDELCVGACVLGEEHRPIAIGRLQRYATDHLFKRGVMPFESASPTGKKVAVVGSGPAGLSCAGELAKRGVHVTVFEKSELPGGLSTYGIVVMREPVAVSLEEVELVKRLGVTVKTGVAVGVDVTAQELLSGFDAVVLAFGTGKVPRLGIPGEEAAGVIDALPFIAATKLAEKDGLEKLRDIPIGREVVVVGAGNTAIDAATVANRLGAERVTMVYRRGREEMTAYDFEVKFVQNEGVDIRLLTQPVEVLTENGRVVGLRCVRMELGEPASDGRRRPVPVPGSEFVLPCDQVIKAIGQEKLGPLFTSFGVETEAGYVVTRDDLSTSNPKVFAAGDCVRLSGDALTVTATRDGKIVAKTVAAALGLDEAPAEQVTGRALLSAPEPGGFATSANPGGLARG